VADERPFGDLPRGHFGAVLADPPWKYVTYSERGQGRSASRHYQVMTFEEIASLPVRDVAASDAWLFLWVPGPHLPFGLQLIECWGFRYSGKAFAWAKQNPSGVGWHMGTGFTTRKNTEDCLLGRRGRPPIKAHDVRELIVAPRRKHSQKPDEQYARIERLVGGPYVELFARQHRPGWHCWGNETDKFEPEYDAQDDFAKSLEEGYRAIRERVAAGGRRWVPK
jgi:N6-adenosine-specific RNA methylase IME4